MRTVIIQFIIFSFLFISCDKEAKSELGDRLEGGSQLIALPDSAPDNWLLTHIDVETTGLLPGYHEMIDIGLVMTDLDGEVIDSMFLLIQPEHPERLSPGAFAVNAFDAEKWQESGALSTIAAVDSIISFHKKNTGSKNVLLVAWNCQFDTAFLDHLFRGADKTWRDLYYYYVLDIPSMAWGLGFKDLTGKQIMEQYDVMDEPHVAEFHTGITGAMKNVRVYRALLRYKKELSKKN